MQKSIIYKMMMHFIMYKYNGNDKMIDVLCVIAWIILLMNIYAKKPIQSIDGIWPAKWVRKWIVSTETETKEN